MYLLFDTGGTKTRVALCRESGVFDTPVIFPTEKDFGAHLQKFREVANDLTQGAPIHGIIGGLAGPLSRDKSRLLNAPNLSEWVDKPIKEELTNAFNVPVYLENDAALVGLGEAVYGAGRDYNVVAYVTVSTGVGGARIVSKRIDTGCFGFEPGHQIIDLDGSLHPDCDARGELEGYISGGSIEKRHGKKPFEITDEAVWEEEAKLLAYGLNNVACLWSPDVIVLGGSMMKNPGIAIPHVKKHLKEILTIFPEIPELVKAELKDVGGLHGGVAYIDNQLGE